MKIKISKILLCTLAVAMLGAVSIKIASATGFYQSRTVNEVMERRRNAKPLYDIGEVQVQKTIIRKTADGRVQKSSLQPALSCASSPSKKRTCPRKKEVQTVPVERTVTIEMEPFSLPPMKTTHVYKPVKRPAKRPVLHRRPKETIVQREPIVRKEIAPVFDEEPIYIQDVKEEAVVSKSSGGNWLQRGLAAFFGKESTGRVDKDGSLFPGGSCESCQKSGPLFDGGPCPNCDDGPLLYAEPCETCDEPLLLNEPCETCEEPLIANEPCTSCEGPLVASEPCTSCNTVLEGGTCGCAQPVPAPVEVRDCCSLAPLYLAHVDFNLDNGGFAQSKIGDYRFRIFGCRRYDRDAILNQGRILQKNMDFAKAFEDATGDCYNIVKLPDDLCLQKEPSPLPEYILTAEVNDVYMNVCDGYDWSKAQASGTRSGSAEITVTWKLSNLTRDKILWEGRTTGYAELRDGTENGEINLIEDAFADAASSLRLYPEFENQLAQRLTPEELTAERQALIDEEVALDPVKCHYTPNFDQCRPQEETCEVVDDAYAQTQVIDTMCIIDRPPYESLTPENLYKVRASVVEISGKEGKKGAGLIISENFVLTSANLAGEESMPIYLKTINGKDLSGRIVRVNTGKNIALIKLDEPTDYTPLSLNLDLPKVGQSGFMVLGMLNVNSFENGENFLDNQGKVTGYRYSEDKGSEIMLDTNVHNTTIGGVLIDEFGTVTGIAHTGQKTDQGKDLFLPTETALRSVGLSICEKLYEKPSPWKREVPKTLTVQIMDAAPVAPEVLPEEERK